MTTLPHQLIWTRVKPLGRWECLTYPEEAPFEGAFPMINVLADVNDPPIQDWSVQESERPSPEESHWCVKDETLYLRLFGSIWTDGMEAVRLENADLFLTQAEAIQKIESAVGENEIVDDTSLVASDEEEEEDDDEEEEDEEDKFEVPDDASIEEDEDSEEEEVLPAKRIRRRI